MIAAVVATAAGVLVSALTAWIPGFHVYNLMALMVIGGHRFSTDSVQSCVLPFVTGLLVGYVVFSILPSILLSAPDESALFTVMPGQRYVLEGRGLEAVQLMAGGAVGAILLLVCVWGGFGPRVMPVLRRVLDPHVHWILWCAVAFMLMSEWPKETGPMQGGWQRLMAGWRSTGSGLVVFALSGWLGFILLYRSPVPVTASFQNLAPAFAGLFTMPWLITNLLSRVRPPVQRETSGGATSVETWIRGVAVGFAGGGMAAFLPVVTGGLGSFLAGHAAGGRDDRSFLISQGASRMVYYIGGFLFFVMPGMYATRGGAAWLLRGMRGTSGPTDFPMALAAVCFAGGVATLLLPLLARAVSRMIALWGYRRISAAAAVFIILMVVLLTGAAGLAVLCVATGIGCLPVAFGTRRMNALGVLLLPMGCRMSGVADTVAGWMGLM